MKHPEGTYRDAILDAVRTRVLDDVERRSLRSRLRRRFIIIALVLAATVSGGIVTAQAVESTHSQQQRSDVDPATVLHLLRCSHGPSATAEQYFSIDFRYIGDGDWKAAMDPIAICTAAWNRSAAYGDSVRANGVTGADLSLVDFDMKRTFDRPGFVTAGGGSSAGLDYTFPVPELAICERPLDGALYVISAKADDGAVSSAEWSRRCAADYDYRYIPEWNAEG